MRSEKENSYRIKHHKNDKSRTVIRSDFYLSKFVGRTGRSSLCSYAGQNSTMYFVAGYLQI